MLVDGLLSARLFGSADGGEMMDEELLHMSQAASDSGKPRRNTRGRTAVLNFHGLEPWRTSFPLDFAGATGLASGFPFAVRWSGDWQLVENPVLGSAHAVKPGRFVAELRGAVGSIRFGRNVHLQAINVARRTKEDCMVNGPDAELLSWALSGLEMGEDHWPPVPSPLVLKGLRQGKEIYSEVVAVWEMGSFVNGAALNAFTTVEPIDEVVLIASDCLLVGVVQASFGDAPMDVEAAEDEPVRAPAPAPAQLPQGSSGDFRLLALRSGWRAYNWDEVELRYAGVRGIGDAAVWNLNDVVARRLTFRDGVFTEPPIAFGEHLAGEQDELLTNMESIKMPPGFEEVPSTALSDVFVETTLAGKRNLSHLVNTFTALAVDTARAVSVPEPSGRHPSEATMLRGLSRRDVNTDLARLLTTLTEAAEDKGLGAEAIAAASNPEDVFDDAWKRLGLHALECLFVRWQVTENVFEAQGLNLDVDEETAAVIEEVIAVVPGAALTHKLVDGIRQADATIQLRVQAKNSKVAKLVSQLRQLTSAQTRMSSGQTFSVAQREAVKGLLLSFGMDTNVSAGIANWTLLDGVAP